MGQRTIRVNALILREINHILRTQYQTESVAITVFEVSVSPDLRNAHAYYSVLGDHPEQVKAQNLFKREAETIRREVGKQIVLKYLPKIKFILDDSMERGARTLSLLDEIDEETDNNER